MAERQQQMQMLHSVLVLQHEAMKSLSREFYQQTEAAVALSGQHPLSQEPLAAGSDSDQFALRAAPVGTANLVSDGIARLTMDTCDAQACVRNTAQMSEFLKRVAEAVKTDDDRAQALFVLDLTLQRARKQRHNSNSSNSNDASSTTADADRSMITHFETTHGYNMLVDWFAEACTYSDESKRQLTKLLLQVLLRNKPKLQFTKGMVIQKLRRTQTFVSGKANKELVTQVLDKYREGST
ncbi:hypothetical protein Gpo141_00003432 [Globisporangium polare]